MAIFDRILIYPDLKITQFFVLCVGVTLASCGSSERLPTYENGKFLNYISLEGKKFKDGQALFYPMVLNYSIDLQRSHNSEELYIAPRAGYHQDYGDGEGQTLSPWPSDSASSHQIIQSHFKAISDMGFNAIRLTGFTATNFYDGGFHTWSKVDLSDTELGNSNIKEHYIPLLKTIVGYAESNNLRVILLLSAVEDQPGNQINLFSKVAEGLADEKALFAYDLYNEPLYFDSGDYTKKQTTEFVESYNQAIKEKAPNQLTTIGLSHYKIVYEWDPELMDVDFLSFHIYPYWSINLSLLERFEAKFYWISRNIDKPWIVGETGLNTAEDCEPLNWSWGTIEEAKEFMTYSMEETKLAGGSGYSWWSFQDMKFKPGHVEGTCSASAYGLVDHKEGSYFLNSGGDTIMGGLKIPFNELPFKAFTEGKPYPKRWDKSYPMPVKEVYYNIDYLPAHQKLFGRVVDEHGRAIEDAIVSVRNPISKSYYFTFSKPDGSFEMNTGHTNVLNHPDFEIQATAVRKNTVVARIADVYSGNGNSITPIALPDFSGQ